MVVFALVSGATLPSGECRTRSCCGCLCVSGSHNRPSIPDSPPQYPFLACACGEIAATRLARPNPFGISFRFEMFLSYADKTRVAKLCNLWLQPAEGRR